MKLKAIIREEVKPSDKTIIVEFYGDDKNQHFEVKCLFSPFYLKMKRWESWILNIKMESEIFIEHKTGAKSYFTHLLCKKAELVDSPYNKGKDSQPHGENDK